ncbi:Uu.00g081560.m01.CDS01 [Anthostomella pinea]|uniref:Uu.00g081560.m01.CDS01 n=1 Tax=Anthostomella pinea TaxID=933095 RepID=A0AAI8VMC5_9PEZI|nr:Uu.00g081560.m01.CDS01 [Anthostomella pinea]
MPSLLRHLHDFAREVDLTVAEWMAGVEMINEAGRMSTDKRNETQLLCDILGLESLVDEITSKLLLRAGDTTTNNTNTTSTTTPSAILGPFYRADAPILPNNSSIVTAPPTSPWYAAALPLLAHVSGRVLDDRPPHTPIPNAVVDVWLAGPNGLYEQQDTSAPDMNLRGRFRTSDPDGHYSLYCLRPTAYPIPDDGPAGRLLGLLDRRAWRPAHIHFFMKAEGYRSLVTQVFDVESVEDEGVGRDAVFAVKEELVVRFRAREGDERARWELVFDVFLSEL